MDKECGSSRIYKAYCGNFVKAGYRGLMLRVILLCMHKLHDVSQWYIRPIEASDERGGHDFLRK
jgi:hypothetical protein